MSGHYTMWLTNWKVRKNFDFYTFHQEKAEEISNFVGFFTQKIRQNLCLTMTVRCLTIRLAGINDPCRILHYSHRWMKYGLTAFLPYMKENCRL